MRKCGYSVDPVGTEVMGNVGSSWTTVCSQIKEVLVAAAVLAVIICAGIAAAVGKRLRPRVIDVKTESRGEPLPKRVLPSVIGHGLRVVHIVRLSKIGIGS